MTTHPQQPVSEFTVWEAVDGIEELRRGADEVTKERLTGEPLEVLMIRAGAAIARSRRAAQHEDVLRGLDLGDNQDTWWTRDPLSDQLKATVRAQLRRVEAPDEFDELSAKIDSDGLWTKLESGHLTDADRYILTLWAKLKWLRASDDLHDKPHVDQIQAGASSQRNAEFRAAAQADRIVKTRQQRQRRMQEASETMYRQACVDSAVNRLERLSPAARRRAAAATLRCPQSCELAAIYPGDTPPTWWLVLALQGRRGRKGYWAPRDCPSFGTAEIRCTHGRGTAPLIAAPYLDPQRPHAVHMVDDLGGVGASWVPQRR